MANELHYSIESKKEPLSKDFIPGDKDVIVGRGKKCYNHVGNQELRRIVQSKLDEYSASTSKHDKSYILACIVAQVRSSGGFVKENPETGHWYDVGDSLAREKISQTFRDALEDKYKSSTAFKRKRRQEKRAKTSPPQCGTDNFPIFMPYHMYQQRFGMYNPSLSQSMTVLDLESASTEQLSTRQSPLSQSLSVLDLESASSEQVSVVERLSSSLPNLWFEEEDPFQPIPIPQGSMTEENSIKYSPNNIDCVEPIKLKDATNHCSNPTQISEDEDSQRSEPTKVSYKDDPWERSVRKRDFLIDTGSRKKHSNINSARSA